MKIFDILLTLILFSVALIIYYSMFGSVVTAITGAVGNWSCIGATFNTTTCINVPTTTTTNMAWMPGILIILSALLPLIALVLVIYAEFKVGQ